MRNSPLVGALTAVLVFLPAVAAVAATDACLEHTSKFQDAADMRGVRAQIEIACPCASFDGSPGKTHGAFTRCARAVILDASDGTPIDGRIKARPECISTMRRTVRRSDCGYAAIQDRHPCCTHRPSGRNSGHVLRAAKCSSTPVRHLCPSFHFVDDACSNNVLNTCNTVGTTTSIASAAEPPNTPGSPGVTVTNAKLLTQFGGASFSLNNATYTRFRMDGGPQPDAILILIPGFEGGANDFKNLAENLIPRAILPPTNLVVEVWAFDRRTNQLEDLAGSNIAERRLEPQIALDWFFGDELEIPLDPVLAAGPNRRAVFYDSTDVPFIANWTPLVFARDIDAVVDAADAVVRNHNVFLGGHSMGTTFTARYASTDFNLSGVGAPQPGYAKLRGLVLLEGSGGSTSGAPLSSDTLDRIIASFDGGLYGAVKNPSSPGRCVDGTTACTIANEAATCAGQVPPKCTLTTTAYAFVPGALNPRVLAVSEPNAIQGAYDPNTTLAIAAVDQGVGTKKCAQGANSGAVCTADSECPSSTCDDSAISKVPDLSGLKFLPVSTVAGGIGSFVNSNGFIASLFPFLATSVGGPGPTIGGLFTWKDIFHGTDAASTPDKGPAPTSLPAPVWGRVAQVTSMTRLLDAFFVGDTNFSDWYYPSSGLSVTGVPGHCSNPAGGTCTGPLPAGTVGAPCGGANFSQSLADGQCSEVISLDSTALSVGRGRRDIENLTQAANVDIPVISFVGSNGLARVPGAMTAFGTSIHRCTAPSCNGTTDRVVDAANPNPAFPTLGGVAGGYEVYVNVGYAHLDVVTAEDFPSNNVTPMLAAFLARNVQ
jgi:pimeloyl-ACP methyl ester carboxylesterase